MAQRSDRRSWLLLRWSAMTTLLAERLRQRVRIDGSAPLLTYYDVSSGERVELSAISFGNWVDKTSNLLVDELAVTEGEAISMPLAHEAPGHWLTAVWQLACWQVGLTVDLTGDSPGCCHCHRAALAGIPDSRCLRMRAASIRVWI